LSQAVTATNTLKKGPETNVFFHLPPPAVGSECDDRQCLALKIGALGLIASLQTFSLSNPNDLHRAPSRLLAG
jgi:hypothetical protein